MSLSRVSSLRDYNQVGTMRRNIGQPKDIQYSAQAFVRAVEVGASEIYDFSSQEGLLGPEALQICLDELARFGRMERKRKGKSRGQL